MKRAFEKLKYAVALKAYRILEARKNARKAVDARRVKTAKNKELRRIKNLQESVTGPDSPAGIQLWMEVMGKRPHDDISQIYALKDEGWGTMNYISFVFASAAALKNALQGTHWQNAEVLLKEGCCDIVPWGEIPEWKPYWPYQPGAGSRKGGFPSSRPFVSDCCYYYLDKPNTKFFLSTGMTHQELTAYVEGKLERSKNEN